jgi:parallel beta-helix repeat protein
MAVNKVKGTLRTRILLVIVWVSLLIYVWGLQASPPPQQTGNAGSNLQARADAPLVIVGNAQLAAAASAGNGSKAAPYLLSNKGINLSGVGQDGISISHTNAHFTLKDCWVIGGGISSYAGVRLFNVSYAWIENVTASHNYYGIVLQEGSDNNTVISNNVGSWVGYGISLVESNNNTITNNIIQLSPTSIGLLLHLSDHNTITGNTACDGQYGIWLITSDYNYVAGNILYRNDYCVYEDVCLGNLIENNDCGTPIPRFPWVAVGWGLLGALGLATLWRRKARVLV